MNTYYNHVTSICLNLRSIVFILDQQRDLLDYVQVNQHKQLTDHLSMYLLLLSYLSFEFESSDLSTTQKENPNEHVIVNYILTYNFCRVSKKDQSSTLSANNFLIWSNSSLLIRSVRHIYTPRHPLQSSSFIEIWRTNFKSRIFF